MSDYRRYFIQGGTYFFTIVTHNREPIFAAPKNVDLLRKAVGTIKTQHPFEINAAVVLPDHLHFLWSLPPGDADFSTRIGKIKVHFTRAFQAGKPLSTNRSESRKKHRESSVWQRRFWEHVVRDEHEFESFYNYIHFNPVKHGLASCPHKWAVSSFHYWVRRGVLSPQWGCSCRDRETVEFDFKNIERVVGE